MSNDRQQAARYEVRVKGHLDRRWAAWFDGLSLTSEGDGQTVIHGRIPDQAALHGLLQRVRDAGIPLVSVTRLDHALDPHAGVPGVPRDRGNERTDDR